MNDYRKLDKKEYALQRKAHTLSQHKVHVTLIHVNYYKNVNGHMYCIMEY